MAEKQTSAEGTTWIEGGVTAPQGFLAGAVACGIKASGRPDLALLASDSDCCAAGVFTRNQVIAAPVIVDRETLASNRESIRAVVVNAGNANACTGEPGLSNARAMQNLTAAAVGCEAGQVLVMSTGVIGVQLPMDRVAAGIRDAAAALSPENGATAARAIMTTDTRPKEAAVVVDLPDGRITLGGMAKGSGMIHPDMATLLGVITTDAEIEAGLLHDCLLAAVDKSFNRISVDGDTSTNDTILALANGTSGIAVSDLEATAAFAAGLNALCHALAQMVVTDGEGAGRVVEIRVTGANSAAEAHQVANTIAISPLVKTAFAGADPNWGRILMAAGRSGVVFDQAAVSLWVESDGGEALQLVETGTPRPFAESDAAAIFAQTAFVVHLDLGQGSGADTVWTTDLTHDYVTINADYRT